MMYRGGEFMKNKDATSQIIFLVILAVLCIFFTLAFALLAGSIDVSLFNFQNLNFSNMIPVLIVCILISCTVMGIAILLVSRSLFGKVRDYLFSKKDDAENS